MPCKVDGCQAPVRYKSACLCQKHYFRVRRYGTTETTRVGKGKGRHVTPDGYVRVLRPGHPLADRAGFVYEHRAVVFDDIGHGPMNCELCGVSVTWSDVHIDHIDNSTDNNLRSNLRPTCATCNTRRGMRAPVEWSRTHKIEFQGERKTPTEWARDPRVELSGKQIVLRKKAGMSDGDALFAPKKTHNGHSREPKVRHGPLRYYEYQGRRLTLAEWAREPDVFVTATAIRARLKAGWPLVQALMAQSTCGRPQRERAEMKAEHKTQSHNSGAQLGACIL